MATPSHYKSNLRDVFFNLFEFLDISKNTLGKAPFGALDEDEVRETLKAFEAICSNEIARSFGESDQTPLKVEDNGDILLPEGVKKAVQTFFKGDWHRLALPEQWGGMSAPRLLSWAEAEFFVGSNPVACIYAFFSLTSVQLLDRFGTDSQKKRFIKNIMDRHWGGTMVLTEPDAGSDVGSGTTKARHVSDDVWEIEGVKRFISNGDFNTSENILHLVLARAEGAPMGTKGLSLFLVPKYWVDADGKMGERNGVFVANLEKKMGIKGSSTCELRFGEKSVCRGLLLGNVQEGIRQMFSVMETARMATGIKSMATMSTAYLNALAYTKERVQGPDLLRAMDKTAPRVPIIKHPDVRRMLMTQKSHAEGMRALCYYTAFLSDQKEILEAAGDKEGAECGKRAELLLPLVKAFNSERAYEVLSLSLQCFGGSGYLQDYPIEQYIRDQKIDTLYEGTTHIQALDLIFRKIAKDGGQTLQNLFADIQATLDKRAASDVLRREYDALSLALSEMQSVFGNMMMKMGESIYFAGLHGNRLMFALAELIIAWLLLSQAEIAAAKQATAKTDDEAFYAGKIASCQFFCQHILPNIGATKSTIENATLDIMNLHESAF